MKNKKTSSQSVHLPIPHALRYLHPHVSLTRAFGDDWFGQKAEQFARFFGTPLFIALQSVIVTAWIILNVIGVTHFDLYPFILLNLAFSLQAAYAAPLILLAQTRQADRDKAHAEADAQHREELARASDDHLRLAAEQTAQIVTLLEQNTQLTEATSLLSQQIANLTREIHQHILQHASTSEPAPTDFPHDTA